MANHPAGKELSRELNPESMAVRVNAARGVSTRGLHDGPFALGGGGCSKVIRQPEAMEPCLCASSSKQLCEFSSNKRHCPPM